MTRAAAPTDGPPGSPPPGQCPSCRAPDLHPLLDLTSPATMATPFASAADALRHPVAPVRLAVCASCGLITNTAFDAATHDHTASFGETQAHSPRFGAYAGWLVERLRPRLPPGGDVLEIGCGRGDLLGRLVEATGARGIGVDPGLGDEHRAGMPRSVTLLPAFFRADLVDRPVDLVLCRHVLEHVHDVAGFLHEIRATLDRAPGATLTLEVPDAGRILAEGAFWDVFYDHCSYLTAGSLARALRSAGLRPVALERVYDGQYLLVDAVPDDRAAEAAPLPEEEPAGETVRAAESFAVTVGQALAGWRDRLARARESGERVAVWGAGAKGVAFLHAVGAGDAVECAVDVDPAKDGLFVPGTGHEIVSPAGVAARGVDLVLVMNPIYADEIETDLRARGSGARVRTL